MKRTALKRTGGGLRRTRLKPMSPKRRKENAACNHLAEFAARWIGGPCWLCLEAGSAWDVKPATQVHHLAGRNHRLRHHRSNLAPLCEFHHGIVTQWQVWEMFQIKRWHDPEGYDVAVVALVYKGKNGRIDL